MPTPRQTRLPEPPGPQSTHFRHRFSRRGGYQPPKPHRRDHHGLRSTQPGHGGMRACRPTRFGEGSAGIEGVFGRLRAAPTGASAAVPDVRTQKIGRSRRTCRFWCERGDSNSHAIGHTHLKRACLPFQHSRISECLYIISSAGNLSTENLRQHRTIWQEYSAKDFASYESYKRAGISVSKKSFRHAGRIFKLSKKFKNTCRLNAKGAFCPLHTSPAALSQTFSARFFDSLNTVVFPPFITARMGQKIGRRPQTQLCGDALKLPGRFSKIFSCACAGSLV